MFVSKAAIAGIIKQYLGDEINLYDLVQWADEANLKGQIDPSDPVTILYVLGRLCVADDVSFGHSDEVCKLMLEELGYSTKKPA
jgi:hypothetical protein